MKKGYAPKVGGWKLLVLGVFSLLLPKPGVANPIPDSTLPMPTIVGCEGANCTINGGTRAGSNLFHSFTQFSVPTGGSSYFNNDSQVANIISRVTGGAVSNIDGILKANGTANLFLLNPNGIIFGTNARLDIGGSLIASTASAIKFSDGTFYSATPGNTPPLLTVNVPVGLQFGSNSGSITVRGEGIGLRQSLNPIDTTVGLHVPSNQTLALVGGDVTLDGGTLKTAGGRIEVGSVGEQDFVSLTPIQKGWSLSYDNVSVFKDIQLNNTAAIDATGLGGGDIQVRGRFLLLRNGSQIEASTLGSQQGGNLIITAEDVQLSGRGVLGNSSAFFANVYPGASGTGGRMNIEAKTLRLEGGAFIQSIVFPSATGNAGDITINAGSLIAQEGSQISTTTLSSGRGGNISINANSVELIGTDSTGIRTGILLPTEGTGGAGNLTINTEKLVVRDGARASTSTRRGGSGGTLTVNATDSVLLSGISSDGLNPSGLFALSGELGPRTVPEDASGSGGSVRVNTGQLIVQNLAQISVSGQGSGIVGDLAVNARSLSLDNNGSIRAESRVGTGGNLNLQASDYILLRNNSSITTNASETASGGNITIDTPSLVALPAENSNITANAIRGRGGNININTQGIYGLVRNDRPTDRSDITASSEFGVSGQVQITTPGIDPSQLVVTLPDNLVNVDALVPQSCGKGAESSNFVVTGRGGLPLNPTETLSGDTVLADFTTLPDSVSRAGQPRPYTSQVAGGDTQQQTPPLVEAGGWVVNEKGQVVLTAEASTVRPHSPWQISATCQQVRDTIDGNARPAARNSDTGRS